ncbi:MAG: citramalate synthase [Firmicutes bacterium]|nr:citramalate synthase [Bacillota bacterium]
MENSNLKIEVLDTTLRDGAQCEGVSFSLDDMLCIAKYLDDFGVTYIEAPCFDKSDLKFFNSELELKTARLCAFSSTRRKDTECKNDTVLNNLILANTETVAIVGKSWDFQVKEILKATLDENINMISSSVKYLKSFKKYIIFDAEHFFDGYINNKLYAFKTIDAAFNAGADLICLCDTNGGTHPSKIEAIVKEVNNSYIDKKIGIHCHNDSGFAVVNTIAAVENGATHIQGTFNGIGERCGNAKLSSILPYLQLKKGYNIVEENKMELLRETAVKISDVSNLALSPFEPYVGVSAFTHKAGLHADGVLKTVASFEHIEPKLVGNERRFLISELSGRNIIAAKIMKYFPHLKNNLAELDRIISELKGIENPDYLFESAEASFVLKIKRLLPDYREPFNIISFETKTGSIPADAAPSEAAIEVSVNNCEEIFKANGKGPVDALNEAFKKALVKFYPDLNKVTLTDYKVRVLDSKSATKAMVRVLITSTDGIDIWTTAGVSADIIKASFDALKDSFEYKLS